MSRHWSVPLYRLLIRLYPRSVRRRFGRDMTECYEDLLDGAAGDRLHRLGTVCRALIDAPFSAVAAHLRPHEDERRRPQRGRTAPRTDEGRAGRRFGRRSGPVEGILKDLSYALRGLVKSPGLSVLAVLSLALGVGANTTMLGMVSTTLWRPLPAPEANHLVRLHQEHRGEYHRLSFANFEDIRRQGGDVFEDILVHQIQTFGLRVDGSSEVVYGELVSPSYFDTLSIRPAAGRLYSAADTGQEGAEPVVVISDHLWNRRFGRDPGLLGRKVLLNDSPFTVVGVADPAFTGTKFALAMDLWVPAPTWARIQEWDPAWRIDRDWNSWLGLGRLREGVSREAAEQVLEPIADELTRRDPEANRDLRLALFDEIDGSMGPEIAGFPRLVGALALAAASIVLLVACANVASLLYARALSRQREIGIRFVLGVGRGRLLRQLLAESLLLSLLGGGVGILISFVTTRGYYALLPALPYRFALDPRPDGRVVLVAIAVSLATALISGLAPAWQASGTSPLAATREGAVGTTASRRARRSLDAVVVAMVALSFVSLVLTGLFVRSLRSVREVDPGFATQQRVVAAFDVGLAGTGASTTNYVERLLEEVRELPGVAGAAVSSLMPLGDRSSSTRLFADDQSYGDGDRGIDTWVASVTPDYFDVMAIPLPSGRTFRLTDDAEGPAVAIVNETLARRLWPGENAVGRRLRFESTPGGPTIEVVGVAHDNKYNYLNEASKPAFYLPFERRPRSDSVLIVETRQDAALLLPILEQTMESVDERVPILDLRTVDSHVTSSLWLFRMGAKLAAALGTLALALSAAGLFGIMTYTVSQRRRELGIRLALGARSRQLMEVIFGRGLRLAALGVGIGAAAALGLGSLISSLLFGVGARDPATYVSVGLLLAAVTALASLAPALTASRADPVAVLRDS